MAILSKDYEPQLDTIKLGEVFRLAIKNSYNIEFEKSIYDIELLRNRVYPINELYELIRGRVNAMVTCDERNIYIRKQYILRGHAVLCTDITIHYFGALQLPNGKVIYMDDDPNAIVTTPKFPEEYKKVVQNVYYGSIEHISRNDL